MLKNVKSKYILNNIIEYIPDKIFKYKLSFYSKYFHRKFGLSLNDFQKQYLYLLPNHNQNYKQFMYCPFNNGKYNLKNKFEEYI